MAYPHITPEQYQDWKDLDGNISMSPTYVDLVTGIWRTLKWQYAPKMWRGYVFPQSFIEQFTQNYYFPIHEVFYIIYIAMFFTLLRYIMERFICKSLADWLELTPLNKKKFPESVWKFILNTSAWLYCAYLLFFRYSYLYKPHLIWDDWSPGMEVPLDIKVLYFARCGSALHSIFAILFMEHKRKDLYAMFVHHVLTTTLIFFSYATRYHKIGLLVLFVHDIADLWLDLTKMLHYLGVRQGGRKIRQFENAATVTFVIFTLSWLVFRLYLFPVKVLYSASVVFPYRTYERGSTLYGFCNLLLWILQALNVYWFFFLLQFFYRLCVGSLSGLHDTREYEEEEDESSMTTGEENKPASNSLSKSNIEDQTKDDITKQEDIEPPNKLQRKSKKTKSQ